MLVVGRRKKSSFAPSHEGTEIRETISQIHSRPSRIKVEIELQEPDSGRRIHQVHAPPTIPVFEDENGEGMRRIEQVQEARQAWAQ